MKDAALLVRAPRTDSSNFSDLILIHPTLRVKLKEKESGGRERGFYRRCKIRLRPSSSVIENRAVRVAEIKLKKLARRVNYFICNQISE
jgi:hypothetical protein